jgi:hypothetical protein
MPSIKITDGLGLTIDADLAPLASLVKYVREVPSALLEGGDIRQLQLLTLNDPAVRALRPTLSFQRPVRLGDGPAQLIVGAEAGASFQVISRTADQTTLFAPDDYGDNIDLSTSECYVGLGLKAAIDLGVNAASGSIAFGLSAGGSLDMQSYRPFSLGPEALTVAEAIRRSIGEFVIPADAEDLGAIPPGVVITINGSGSLKFSAGANLLVITNPLASVSLPSPAPALGVTAGGSVIVDGSWTISTDYQVRIQRVETSRVRLGWYHKRNSEFSVSATAGAGVQGGTPDTDLFQSFIAAISSNAAADRNELRAAGLSATQIAAINDAVAGAVNRKLELSVAAEFGSLGADEAAFLYEIDLTTLGADGKQAVHAALGGDLSGLADPGALPAGIREVRSILSRARASRFRVKVNLLGIFNLASVSQLALNGTVTFMPSTGELVIADQATASLIRTSAVNFGVDEDKLREVMAERFLITAAYRGSRTVVPPPQLFSSHVFFRLDNDAGRDDIRRIAALASALGLSTVPIPGAITDFGRCSLAVETHYDDAAARALFLNAAGAPRDHTEYEAAGRRALALLVLPDGDDAFRLRPADDDGLWNEMKAQGPANFTRLLPATQAEGVRPDYLAIEWWADSMRDTAEILAEINRLTGASGASTEDPRFEQLRQKLADHLRQVAQTAHQQFGTPWGLVALFLASGGKARAEIHFTGPRLVYAAESALTVAQ